MAVSAWHRIQVLLSRDEMLQLSGVQCVAEVLAQHAQYGHLLLKADIAGTCVWRTLCVVQCMLTCTGRMVHHSCVWLCPGVHCDTGCLFIQLIDINIQH